MDILYCNSEWSKIVFSSDNNAYSISDFYDGVAIYRKSNLSGRLIDANGNIISDIYDSIYGFSEGLAPAKKNGKWGFIDKTGKAVIPFKYSLVYNFENGIAVVYNNGNELYIDKNNNISNKRSLNSDFYKYYYIDKDSIGVAPSEDIITGEEGYNYYFAGLDIGDIYDRGKYLFAEKDGKFYKISEGNHSFSCITFANASYTYDGTEKALIVSGNLPEGAKVTYTNNKATNAGTYNATAKITCDGYNDLTLTAKLTIEKAPITVKANDIQVVKGASIPSLTYTITSGKLFGSDNLTGALATKGTSSKIGNYDITQGTLKATSNYNLTFTKGTLSVVDKTPQTIKIGSIPEKTFGDTDFDITVTPDSASGLQNFTYVSSNTNVAEINANGIVTIKASAETEITEGITATTVVYGDTAKVDITDSSALTEDTAVIDLTAEDVNAVAISAEALKNFADNDKAIEIKVKDETGKDTSITFNKAALNALTNGVTEDVTIRISNPENDELTDNQQEKIAVVSSKTPLVYSLTVEGGNTDFGGNNVTVRLYYDKGTSNGNIVVKYIKDDGTEEIITNNANYNSTDKTITLTLSHFSEYLVYTQPQSSHRSGGGSSLISSNYTIKLDTNGGDALKDISIQKGQAIGTIPTPTKKGYVFNGWYSDEKLTKEYSADEKVTASTTLYAGWKVDPIRQLVLTIGKKEATVWNEAKSNDVAPVIRNDRTMLPARFVAENLGATVEWVGEEQKVVITRDDVVIILYIDSDKAYVNNEEVTLDSPAFIENDRTYTPLRFIA